MKETTRVMCTPIKRDSLSQKIQNRIIEMIRNGQLMSDKKIPSEREFCESFQVSRTSVREALKGLISIGLLEKRTDGTYVRSSTEDIVREPLQMFIRANDISMKDISEAREGIECQIVRLAAERAELEDIAACRNLLERIENSASPQEALVNKAKFHMSLAHMTKNPLLISMFSVLYDVLNEFRISDACDQGEDHSAASHGEILEHIAAHDAVAAEQAMRQHLAHVRNKAYSFS